MTSWPFFLAPRPALAPRMQHTVPLRKPAISCLYSQGLASCGETLKTLSDYGPFRAVLRGPGFYGIPLERRGIKWPFRRAPPGHRFYGWDAEDAEDLRAVSSGDDLSLASIKELLNSVPATGHRMRHRPARASLQGTLLPYIENWPFLGARQPLLFRGSR